MEEEFNELLATPTPEHHRDYWQLLYRLVLRGQLPEARELLMHHSQAQTNSTVRRSCDAACMSCDTACMSCDTACITCDVACHVT